MPFQKQVLEAREEKHRLDVVSLAAYTDTIPNP